MIKADDLKQSVMQMVFFGDGTDPKHVQLCQCVEHPRLMRIWVQLKDKQRKMMYMVDYKPISVKEAPDRYEVLAQALNEAYEANPERACAVNVEKAINVVKETLK